MANLGVFFINEMRIAIYDSPLHFPDSVLDLILQ